MLGETLNKTLKAETLAGRVEDWKVNSTIRDGVGWPAIFILIRRNDVIFVEDSSPSQNSFSVDKYQDKWHTRKIIMM